MMNTRTAVLILQALGAITLFAYPGVFLAGIMSFAASGDASGPAGLVWMAFLAASFVYPLIWVLLWWLSWRALRQNRPRRAVLLSSPPALIAAAGLLLTGALNMFGTAGEYSPRAEIEHATKQNAVVGALLSFRADVISAKELHEAIQRADAADLSRPVDPSPNTPLWLRLRSPLAIALESTGLGMDVPLRAVNDGFVEAARLMRARGAQLSSQEIAKAPDLVWLVEVIAARTQLPDNGAQQENPVAWVVLTTTDKNEQYVTEHIRQGLGERRALLSTPTRTYGTPLRIALTRPITDAARALISEGALLSASEHEIPSLSYQLHELLGEHPYLRDRYFESQQRAATRP
jgi:hypothetical protein